MLICSQSYTSHKHQQQLYHAGLVSWWRIFFLDQDVLYQAAVRGFKVFLPCGPYSQIGTWVYIFASNE